MNRVEYICTEQDRDMRLEKVLLRRMKLSSGSIRSLKFSSGILLDGLPTHTDRKVFPGQRVTALFEDTPHSRPEPLSIPLSIPWQDDQLMVVEKPAPLASIRSSSQEGLTLENAIYAYLGCPEDFIYRPVNRLDKGTSGLMVIARNAYIQQRMQSLLHTDSFIRRYIAVTDGAPKQDAGVISLPIAVREGSVKRFIDESGKASETLYRVLSRQKDHACLQLTLRTGRTHQIRVHLAALGCPVTGDHLYGKEHPAFPGRFALHSAYLSFTHPLTGEKLTFESTPPFLSFISGDNVPNGSY